MFLSILIFTSSNKGYTQAKEVLKADQIEVKHLLGKWVLTALSQKDSMTAVPASAIKKYILTL